MGDVVVSEDCLVFLKYIVVRVTVAPIVLSRMMVNVRDDQKFISNKVEWVDSGNGS